MRKGFLQRVLSPTFPPSNSDPQTPIPSSCTPSSRSFKRDDTTIVTQTLIPIPCNPIPPDKLVRILHWEWELACRNLRPFRFSINRFPHSDSPCMIVLPPTLKTELLAAYNFPATNVLASSKPRGKFHIGKSLIPNAGLGMLADMDLTPGDLILIEEPVIAFPTMMPALILPSSGRDTMQEGFERLNDDEKAFVKSLRNAKPYTAIHSTELNQLLSTNGLCMNFRDGDPSYSGLGRDLVRMNHSCAPNAHYAWSVENWAWYLWTITPIKAGDEITISYVGNTPSDERQQRLKDVYGINPCACSLCTQPKDVVATYDKLSSEIHGFKVPNFYIQGKFTLSADPDLDLAISNPNPVVLLTLLRKSQTWVDKMQKFGCWDREVFGFHGRRLVKGYLALGETKREKAKEMCELVRLWEKCWICRLGKEGDEAWGEVLGNLERTEWWGRAVKVNGDGKVE